ncbi:26S proteasome non-ATPase regulatory subunit 10-like, partial [Octopus sinensis]|uniref:26S proteasome non-ATPase regulatory subunit 10-like n=1 Tax=Octopus sinensis TaxID=2607531 RepID=A0A7E6EGX3_9MOLL
MERGEGVRVRDQRLNGNETRGKTDVVAFLVSSGANVNKQNSFGNTPLHLAVENNYEDVVKVLLNSKENNNLQVNLQNRDGWTALHVASGYG